MKFSGFTLFMLLLVLLIVSVLFCRCCMQYSEGFIAYQENLPALDQVTIPMYSDQHKLYKLYDSLYFDNKNGNLIEVEEVNTSIMSLLTPLLRQVRLM